MSQPDTEPGADAVDAPTADEVYEDQDSEPTNTAPPGERPTDPGQVSDD